MAGFHQREEKYGPIIREAFQSAGLPPEWGMALARQESAFIPDAHSQAAGDIARGGSWGLCQMSLQTAQSLGYTGDGPGLCDPVTNVHLAAKLCAQLANKWGHDLAEVASRYNSGKALADAPASTRTVYVPRVLAYAREYAPLDSAT